MSFLVPLFLAGGLLLIGPWLIHRIRRPEREERRFSSLMFLPDIKKDVIEPRKLQHILLMLLRMALLALLVLAFSRPYEPETNVVALEQPVAARHFIMLDVSYSLGEAGLARAVEAARAALADAPAGEAVGLAEFAAEPRLLIPLSAAAGVRDRIRAALSRLSLRFEPGDFPRALRFGEAQLLADAEPETPLYLHFISDFQRTGLPDGVAAQRISSRVRFAGHPVETEADANLSVDEITADFVGDRLTVAAKIKNWSRWEDRELNVALFIEGEQAQQRKARVPAGNAVRVAFDAPELSLAEIKGRVEILDGDALPEDNRRRFVWRPQRKKRLWLAAAPRPDKTWRAALFMDQALRGDDFPWQVETLAQEELTARLAAAQPAPEMVALCDLDGFSAELGAALTDFARAGGSVLIALGDGVSAAELNANLLAGLGWRDAGPRFENTLPERFVTLSRLQFEHPLFQLFKGARYNDFSQLRFRNYRVLSTAADAAEDQAPEVLARFGDGGPDGAPAIVETELGAGRIMLWAFNPDLEWTNLPQTVKFLPLVREAIVYLGGVEPPPPVLRVGDRLDWARLATSGETRAGLPDGREIRADAEEPAALLRQPGFLALGTAAEAAARHEPVNLDPRESDPGRLPLDEFTLRLTANRVAADAAPETAGPASAEYERKREYGRAFLYALAVLLLLETCYAVALSAKRAAAQKSLAGGPSEVNP